MTGKGKCEFLSAHCQGFSRERNENRLITPNTQRNYPKVPRKNNTFFSILKLK
jgi:hypothetical protein